MNTENLYLLLDIIFRNGSIKRLSREGIDYNDIAKQTQKAIKDGLVSYDKERVVLTKKGINLHRKLEKDFKKTNKDEWIEKDFKSQIPSIDKNTIFVSRQNELTF